MHSYEVWYDLIGVKSYLLLEGRQTIFVNHGAMSAAVPSPLPVIQSLPPYSLCAFTVMSTNPEIYVPAGKHGLPFIVLR